MIEPPEVFYGLKRQSYSRYPPDSAIWEYGIEGGGRQFASLRVEYYEGSWVVNMFLLSKSGASTEIHRIARKVTRQNLEAAMLDALDFLRGHLRQYVGQLETLDMMLNQTEAPTLWERLDP